MLRRTALSCNVRQLSSVVFGQNCSLSLSVPVDANLAALRSASRMADPEKPKQPMTPWIGFLNDYRSQNKSENRKPTETMKLASAKWKVMSSAEREPWDKPYEAAKAKYQVEVKEYVDSGKRDAWKRDPEKPKRPMSGYLRYAQTLRAQNSHLSICEQSKAAGAKWKSLSEAERQEHNMVYKKEKEVFDVEMKKYKESGKEDKWKEKVGLAGKDTKTKEQKAALKAKEAAARAKIKLKEKNAALKAKAAAAKAKMQLKTENAAKGKEADAKAKLKLKEKHAALRTRRKAATDKQRLRVKKLEDAFKQARSDTKQYVSAARNADKDATRLPGNAKLAKAAERAKASLKKAELKLDAAESKVRDAKAKLRAL